MALRSVLESVGKLYGWPHLEKLFINTDIPQEVQAEFKAYSGSELKRLNAHIAKLDEQIARCMVIHQMLGTRISDTLTLRRDCLSQVDGMDIVTIQQVKTTAYEKPVRAEVAALIRKAIQCSEKRHGEAAYIFVDERDKSRPLQYTTIKHKVLNMILKEDLRGDKGERFRFTTHMFRRTYGAKLTELHLDDGERISIPRGFFYKNPVIRSEVDKALERQAGSIDPRRSILDKAMDERIELLQRQVAELKRENENLRKENEKLKKGLGKKDRSIFAKL